MFSPRIPIFVKIANRMGIINSILFVCHGNICRSPMAEFIMKHISDIPIYIESAAVSDEEHGNHIYPPAKRILEKKGIPFDKNKTARKITKDDYSRFDKIVAMDNSNLHYLLGILGNDSLKKISLLKDYTTLPGNISDPWYTGDFEKAFNDIEKGCKGLLQYIKNEKM